MRSSTPLHHEHFLIVFPHLFEAFSHLLHLLFSALSAAVFVCIIDASSVAECQRLRVRRDASDIPRWVTRVGVVQRCRGLTAGPKQMKIIFTA
jgi:hypothetical protein